MNHEHHVHPGYVIGAHHADHGTMPASHDHAAMIADFRQRFWISLILTLPILVLSPTIQGFLQLGSRL